jgi:3-phytase
MTINGTPDNDDLFVIGQNEDVFGEAGNDTLDASGGQGNNTLYGGVGNDELYANQNDRLLGEAGNDDLYAVGIGGNNTLSGGDDGDRLFVVEGNSNTLTGDGGNDELYIIEGSLNTLQGGIGDDFLKTSSTTGNNTLEGGEGDDTLIGYVESDRLFGDNGNDYLYAGKLGTEMTGGAGLDRYYFGNGEIPDEPAVVNDFTQGDDKVIIAGISQVQTFEDIILEQQGNDTLVKADIDGSVVTFGILRGIVSTDLTAADFDFLVPRFSITEASAEEGNTITFTVTRSDDFLTEQTVTVSTSIGDGDTASENDFTAISQTLTFAQGQTTQTFTVQTTEDVLFEGDETFTVSLSNPQGGAVIDNTQNTAIGTILNDEPAPVFSIAAAEAEEGEDIVFTVTRTGDAQAHQTVTVSTSIEDGNTATQDDFTANTDTILTFAQGQTTQTFTVQTTEDVLFEGDETFTVSLSDPQGGAVIDDTQNTAIGTILNDDQEVQTEFSISSATAKEGNELEFTITRTGDAQAEQTVTVSTSIEDGDTATQDDFTPKTETLTFAQGETSKEFTVQTTEDFLVEEDEKFTVSLNSATNGATISSTDGITQGTIEDDDILSLKNNIFSIRILEQFVALKAVLLSSSSRSVNEVGIFVVDDEDGTIDGVSREDANYTEVVLERIRTQSTSIFSILENFPNNFRTETETNSLIRLLGFESGQNLQFFLVNGGTIEEYRTGRISDRRILFGESFSQITQEEGSFTISFRERTTRTEFNSLVIRLESVVELTQEELFLTEITQFQGTPEQELIDLTNYATVTADFSVFREAAFDNEVYFFRVDDRTGSLGTIEATEENRTAYIQEVINSRLVTDENGELIRFAVDNQGEFRDTTIIQGGSIIAPMIIVNGSLSELTDNNTNNDPRVYFPFLGVNSDGADHIRMLGNNIFGFEDLPNGGDKDYNDIIVSLRFTEIV